ncbi:hypothetical protein A2Z22_05115 [Candidatus Woesebacteria bacterium RBG_16_34_12]|uniref:2,3-diketo-5-methylthio-1-phosphopentane phosphatase n=1 Tax=Candidatus Woesebacteria bacterium RBG_16_34_12 TaxID=1802480 RepID=A0A1F7X8K0_9BACT|nr:MAG: hypothetical protein A2Z22_05115 [Candidatus Woesebacteria bacterium RBG_16_34_12]
MYKQLVLCDFDGTITIEDVTDEILKKFASRNWINIGQKYLRGEIYHSEMNKRFTEIVNVTPLVLRNYLRLNIHIRKNFYSFLKFLIKKGIPLVIISSGWDFYIREILSMKGMFFLKTINDLEVIDYKHINIISNKIYFNNKLKGWGISFPWVNYSCKISSPCKGLIAEFLREKCADKIVTIGNSSTDLCMVENSDQVFCTGELTKICLERGIASKHFDSFKELELSFD